MREDLHGDVKPREFAPRPGVVFAVEKFAVAYADAVNLLHLHWDEVAPYKDLLLLNPDLLRYQQLEASGALHVVTARLDGLLIGYIVMIVSPHLHYRHVLIATDDIHFIHPEYRKGSLGSRLIISAEKLMKNLGAKIMVLRTKANNSHGLLFERMGYTALDITYSKRLDGD